MYVKKKKKKYVKFIQEKTSIFLIIFFNFEKFFQCLSSCPSYYYNDTGICKPCFSSC
jgi:hypothetical protein